MDNTDLDLLLEMCTDAAEETGKFDQFAVEPGPFAAEVERRRKAGLPPPPKVKIKPLDTVSEGFSLKAAKVSKWVSICKKMGLV